MNMPNFASRHHCMRSWNCAGVSFAVCAEAAATASATKTKVFPIRLTRISLVLGRSSKVRATDLHFPLPVVSPHADIMNVRSRSMGETGLRGVAGPALPDWRFQLIIKHLDVEALRICFMLVPLCFWYTTFSLLSG